MQRLWEELKATFHDVKSSGEVSTILDFEMSSIMLGTV